jgi:hypothetical protein
MLTLTQSEPVAMISCPSREDDSWELGSSHFAMARLEILGIEGVRIVLARQPRLGMKLSVEFHRGRNTFSNPFTARVTRVSKHPQSGWFVDCEFAKKVTEEELKAAMAPAGE